MKKIFDETNLLSKLALTAIFGVGFVAPLLVVKPALANNFGLAGKMKLFDETDSELWAKNYYCAIYSKNDKGRSIILEGTSGTKHEFKICAVDGNKVTLWCYDNSFGRSAYCTSSENNYQASTVRNKVLLPLYQVSAEGVVTGELSYYTLYPYYDLTEKTSVVNGDYVWLPSYWDMESNGNFGLTSSRQRKLHCEGDAWLREDSAGFFGKRAFRAVLEDGNLGSGHRWVGNIVRPALVILNEQNYVFSSQGNIASDGIFRDDSGSGDTKCYVKKNTAAPTWDTSSITLNGSYITISADIKDKSFTLTGLLTTKAEDNATWQEVNTDSASIAYMTQPKGNTFDLSQVECDKAFTLKLFGVKGTDVTELNEKAIAGIGMDSDGRAHVSIGYQNQNMNIDVQSGGGVVDLQGDADNAITIKEMDTELTINLNGYTYSGEVDSSDIRGYLTLNGGDEGVFAGTFNLGDIRFGRTTINGNVICTGVIDSDLTISGGATFTGDAIDTYDGYVYNYGTWNMQGGTLMKQINGRGTLVIQQDTTLAATVSGQDIRVDPGVTLTAGSIRSLRTTDKLTLNSGSALNIASKDGTKNFAIGSLSTDGEGLLIFTADLSKDQCDSLSANTISSGTTLSLDGMNIINEDNVYNDEKLQVVKSDTDQLANLTLGVTRTATSGGAVYEFKQDTEDRGAIVATKFAKNYTLPEIVQGIDADAAAIETYSLTGDYTLPAILGTLQNADQTTNREFTIIGNTHVMDGDDKDGITVGAGGTLNLLEIADIKYFKENVLTVQDQGTANIIDSKITGNVTVESGGVLNAEGTEPFGGGLITNNGTVNFSGNKISGIFCGTGSLNILGDAENNFVDIRQNKLTVGENATYTGHLEDLYISSLENEGTLNISTYGSEKQMAFPVTGAGTLVLDGADVIAQNKIENSIQVKNAGDSLTIKASNIGGTMETAGTVILKGGTLHAGHTISGSGKVAAYSGVTAQVQDLQVTGGIVTNRTLYLTGEGSLSSDITQETRGDLYIVGSVAADGHSITQNSLTVGSAGSFIADVNNLHLGCDIENGGTITLTGDGALAHGIYDKDAKGKFIVDGNITVYGNVANNITINANKTLTIEADSTSTALLKVDGNGTLVLDAVATGVVADLTLAGGIVINKQLTLSGGGTLAIYLNGEGSLVFTDATSANMDYLRVTGGIINNSDLTLTDSGTIFTKISGSGSLVNTGTLYADGDNVAQAMTNNGTYEVLGGTVAHEVSGNGTMNIQSDTTLTAAVAGQNITVAEGATLRAKEKDVLDNTDSLNLQGSLDISGADCETLVRLKSLAAASTSNLLFSAQIKGDGNAKSDSLDVGTITAGSILNIEGINLVDYDLVNEEETIVLITADAAQLANLTINPTTVAVSDGYSYTFEQDENNRGLLKAERQGGADPEPEPEPEPTPEPVYKVTLPRVVQNQYDQGYVDSFSLVDDYELEEDLGTLTRVDAQTSRILTIFGNNKTLDGQGFAGIIVNDGDVLNLDGLDSMTNFTGNIITTAGTVNVDNSKLVGDVLVNGSGSLTLKGSSSLQGKLTIEETGFAMILDTAKVQGEIAVPADGALYAKAAGFLGGIANEGYLSLEGSGAMESNVTGGGYVSIYGEVATGGHSLQQKEMYIASNASLTAAYGDISSIKTISDYGSLTLTDDAALLATISGSGSLMLQGETSANVDLLTLTGNITTDKTLTLTGTGVLAAEVGGAGSLSIAGNVTTILDCLDVATAVAQAGNLIISDGGILAKTISGAGCLTLQEAVTTAVANLQVAETVNTTQLILTGTGTLNSQISGSGVVVLEQAAEVTAAASNLTYTGKTIIDGKLILSSGSWAPADLISGEGNLAISSGAALWADADKIDNVIINDGTYIVLGGTVAHAVSGSGAMNIQSDTTLTAAVAGQNITVAEGAILRAKEKDVLDNTDSLNLQGSLDISGADCETVVSLKSLAAASTSNLLFSAQIKGDGNAKSDSLDVGTITAGSILNIEGINLVDYDLVNEEETIVLITADAAQLANLTINPTTVAVSDGYSYTFEQDENNRGWLKAERQGGADPEPEPEPEPTPEPVYKVTLPRVIQNQYGQGIVDSYSLTSDYELDEDLGTFTRVDDGKPRTLTIFGNDYSLNGAGYQGVRVEEGDTLKLWNVDSMYNFSGNIITSSGSVLIYDSLLVGDVEVGKTGSLFLHNTKLQGDMVVDGTLTTNNLSGNIIGKGTTIIYDEVSTGDYSLQQGKLEISKDSSLTAAPGQLNISELITNQGDFILMGSGSLSTKIAGAGTTYVKAGTVQYTGESIANAVVIASGATLDPSASVFGNTVDNSGTLILEGGTLGVAVTNNGGAILSVTQPVALTAGGSLAFVSGSTLDVGTKLGEAVFTNITDAAMLTVSTGSILNLAGDNIVNGGEYTLLQGSAVNDIANLWDEDSIEFDPRITHDRWVLAEDTLSLQVNFTTDAELNVLGLAGVQQGMISVNNQTSDAVAEHLSLAIKGHQDTAYEREVWATYIRNKDDVAGLMSGGYGSDYRAQYNGVIVGLDLATSKKAITGLALSYATGDTNGSAAAAQIRNESKYYGVSLYNRVTNNHSAFITDLGFTHGKNELNVSQWDTTKVNSEGDAKVNSFTAGVRWERDIRLKGSKLVPFVGVRYLHLQNKDFTNNKNLSYTTDNQNLVIPKLGLGWSGEYKMSKSNWIAKPHGEIGYLWNLGNRNADVYTNVNGYPLDTNFDVTDRNSYYLKAGVEFVLKHFSCGLDYSYAKGDAIRGNKWNVNASWSF